MAAGSRGAATTAALVRREGVSVSAMAVPAAFSDLMEISSQVETAIVVDGEEIVASNLADQDRSERFAAAVRSLVEAAERTRVGVKQVEVALPEGHMFVVREGAQVIGAATAADPPSGLVFYDLRACLSGLAVEAAQKDDAAK
jgi:predicted regulator of Ras-like GTPase activity (Roadblock/LC7/MglB family)